MNHLSGTMLSRAATNWILQKHDAVARRLRLGWYRFLGMRLPGDAVLRRIEVPRNLHDIEVGHASCLDDNVVLLVSGAPREAPKIVIGTGCYINRRTMIDASLRIEIGDHAGLGPNCYITDHDHGIAPDRNFLDQELVEAPTRIGPCAWLGAGVTVLKGVTVGAGAVIGAGSVVTRDVPDGAIAVGVPARVVRQR